MHVGKTSLSGIQPTMSVEVNVQEWGGGATLYVVGDS
jgi:hypothetical protein